MNTTEDKTLDIMLLKEGIVKDIKEIISELTPGDSIDICPARYLKNYDDELIKGYLHETNKLRNELIRGSKGFTLVVYTRDSYKNKGVISPSGEYFRHPHEGEEIDVCLNIYKHKERRAA